MPHWLLSFAGICSVPCYYAHGFSDRSVSFSLKIHDAAPPRALFRLFCIAALRGSRPVSPIYHRPLKEWLLPFSTHWQPAENGHFEKAARRRSPDARALPLLPALKPVGFEHNRQACLREFDRCSFDYGIPAGRCKPTDCSTGFFGPGESE